MRRGLILAAASIQAFCVVLFLIDIAEEIGTFDWNVAIEAFAVVALIVGSVITLREAQWLSRRNRAVEAELSAASGAFQETLEAHFGRWCLTPAECDVALMTVKGLSNAEIADLRGTRSGTIKAQSAAIYRKAGVASRSELMSVVIEDLIAGIGLPAAD